MVETGKILEQKGFKVLLPEMAKPFSECKSTLEI